MGMALEGMLLTVAQATAQLNDGLDDGRRIDTSAVYRLLDRGVLQEVSLGSRRLVLAASVEKLKRKRAERATAPASE